MRFETIEKIGQQDAELVLRTLEACLREVSTDIQRTGEEIILHGLGPSPLAVNRRDTTVLRVQSEKSENITVIRADVTFQASALLGNAPQCDLVRSKLDRVFERVRMQIDFETSNSSWKTSPEAASSAAARQRIEIYSSSSMQPFGESSQLTTESEPPAGAQQRTAASQVEEEQVKGIPEEAIWDTKTQTTSIPNVSFEAPAESFNDQAAPEIVAAESFELAHIQPSGVLPATDAAAKASLVVGADSSSATGLTDPSLTEHAEATTEPLPDTTFATKKPATRAVFNAPHQIEEPALLGKKFASVNSDAEPRHNWTAAMLAGALLLFGPGLYLAHRQHQSTPAALPQTPPVSHAPELEPAPPPAAEPAQSTSATDNHAVDSSDPQIWLQSWLAAQANGDAAAQAGFYADKVDHYLGKRNVTNAEILSEKQSAILRRQGRWTVKLEDVNLRRKDNGEVSVYLVKHYEAQTEPAEIAEQYIPSHLELRSIDGQWKIVSEQDLPTIEPALSH